MRWVRRAAILLSLALATSAAGRVLAQLGTPAPGGGPLPAPASGAAAAPAPSEPAPATLALGALLPLRGSGAWFGEEIRQGLELAAAELAPRPRRPAPGTTGPEGAATAGDGGTVGASAPAPGTERPAAGPTRPATATPATTPAPAAKPTAGPAKGPAAGSVTGKDAEDGASPEASRTETTAAAKKAAEPPIEPIETPNESPRTVQLKITTRHVPSIDIHDATTEFATLAGQGVSAVFTASPTPTLAVLPLAAPRDMLVVHAGLATDRFPRTGRTLLQLRPSLADRGEVLAAHAWVRGIRRLALLADGDDLGRAVRAGVATQWRQRGAVLAHDESLLMDASDVQTRIRALLRTAPEAVVLAYRGAGLGEAARRLRAAGYTGLVLGADDDRAALLAAGPALDGALLVTDGFIPEPGTRGARFTRAYQAKHKRAPSHFAASAYETAILLADAAAASLAEGRTMAGRRLRDQLGPPRRFPSLYAGELTVRDDGLVIRPLALFRVEQEKLTPAGYVGRDGQLLAPPRAFGAQAPVLAFSR